MITKHISVRWSDLDPNYHVKHSSYYDFGAQFRVEVLADLGLTIPKMQEYQIGPVLFREECIFKREIRFGVPVYMDVFLTKCREDFSRWSLRHHFKRADDDSVCAILNVDGAWMHTQTRKITAPPQIATDVLLAFPKTDDFYWEQPKQATTEN